MSNANPVWELLLFIRLPSWPKGYRAGLVCGGLWFPMRGKHLYGHLFLSWVSVEFVIVYEFIHGTHDIEFPYACSGAV